LGGKCIRVPRHALETWVGAIGKTPSQPATAVGEPANGRWWALPACDNPAPTRTPT